MSDQQFDNGSTTVDAPISVSHLTHILRAYAGAIGLALCAVGIAYAIVAILLYLSAPSRHVTTQAFRIEFRGAAQGQYPNGTRFSAAEIVSTPILLRVFEANELSRFTSFEQFSRSVFVLESNPEFEALAAEYHARLADPKLTAVDRERIQKDFDLKRQSLSKNQFSINYARSGNGVVPERIVNKVLVDTLATWAKSAVTEQHVLEYDVAVLSPNMFIQRVPLEQVDAVVAIQILRSKIMRVIKNIDELHEFPAAQLARTAEDRLSLTDIRLQLEDVVRFRLEPLVPLAKSSESVPNLAATIQFLEAQLAYDQRQLDAVATRAEAARQALVAYSASHRSVISPPESTAASRATGADPRSARTEGSETVMPQLSDSFIDRLMTITSSAADADYRQKLVEQYRAIAVSLGPLEQAVAYDRQILDELRSPSSGRVPGSDIRAQIEATRAEVQELVADIGSIYQALSRNLNPSTQLYTLSGTAVSRLDRAVNPKRLALYGVLILLITLPIALVGALLHNRIREEDAATTSHDTSPATSPTKA